MIDGIAEGISIFCNCQYPSQYIKQWNVKCRQSADNNADVIVTAQLMPTNMNSAASLMDAMSSWIRASTVPTIDINNTPIKVNKNCKVEMDHPYGNDCVESAQASSSSAVSGNDDDDDDNSAGAAVGGVIAGLLIICITIVVLVIVVMLLRRREKR